MPISEKQLEANRRNALRSTGPRTEEGKARSSRNNLRHGLTGQVTVLPSEDREAHDTFCNRLIAGFNPENPLEEQLAHSIAEDAWRLNRITAIENNIFALGRGHDRGEVRNALADAQSFLDHAGEFNLLSLYEQRIHRNMQRNVNQLRELQKEHEAGRARSMEEIKPAARQTLAAGNSSDSFANGFESSNTQIHQAAPEQLHCVAAFDAGSASSPARNHEHLIAA